MSPTTKGCLIAAVVGVGLIGLLFAGIVFVAIIGSLLPSSPQSNTSAQASATPAQADRGGTPRPLSASVSDDSSGKLVGMSADEAYEYGRLMAHAMFDDVKAKTADLRGTVSEQKIRSSFPTEMDPHDEALTRKNARSLGVSSTIIDRYFAGLRTGFAEVRSGR